MPHPYKVHDLRTWRATVMADQLVRGMIADAGRPQTVKQYKARLVPDSESLREYNKCHDPATGRFASATKGVCDERWAQGRKASATAIRDLRRTAQQPGIAGANARHTLAIVRNHLRARRQRLRNPPATPGYLSKDMARAKRLGIAVFTTTSGGGTPPPPPVYGVPGPFQADLRSQSDFAVPALRVMGVDLRQRHISATVGMRPATKGHNLSAFRHELGHFSPTALGKTAVVAGVPMATLQRHFGDEKRVEVFVEEIRAWRNAIRDSGGRVRMPTMYYALATYVYPHVTNRREAKRIHQTAYRTLQRYARRVRRKR